MIIHIIKWSVLAIGILAASYGLLQTARARLGENRKPAQGFFIWPNIFSGVLGILVIAGTLLFGKLPDGWAPGIALGVSVGWLMLFVLFLSSRAAGRKLAVENAGPEQVRAGYNLLSVSGFVGCAVVIMGVGILTLVTPSRSLADEMLLPLALGFWLAAAFWSLPSALYRGLLSQEANGNKESVTPLFVQFRSASGEIAFLTAAVLVTGAAIAGYRFPDGSMAGVLYPMSAFAASLVSGMIANPFLAPGRSRPLRWIGYLIFLFGTGAAAYFLATRFLGDVRAFYSIGIGLITAMFLILSARYRPPFMPFGAPLGVEVAVAEMLMVLGSAVLAFRWMGGYGIALCSVGVLSSAAVLFPTGALWAIRYVSEDSGETDLSLMAHAASRFGELIMAGGASLAIVALLRLFTERSGLRGVGIDITDPYPLAGLVIGGSFPVILRALSQSAKTSLHVLSLDRSVLMKLGRWAAVRTLWIWLLAALTPLAVAVFFRIEAAGAFLVGLAASEFFLILTLWLGEVKSTADESTRLATRSTHVMAVGSGIVAVLLVPPVIHATDALTPTERLWGLLGLAAILGALMMIVAWRRLRQD